VTKARFIGPGSGTHLVLPDQEAACLARGVGKKLPKHGLELRVVLPNGKQAWLNRQPVRHEMPHQKRGWVWAVYDSDRAVYDWRGTPTCRSVRATGVGVGRLRKARSR
jgi:hypothetical protein